MIGKLSRLFFKEDTTSPDSPNNAATRSVGGLGFLGFPTSATRNVSPRTALSFSPVYSAVNLISNDLATLPISVYQETDDGNIKQTKHIQSRLLKKKPHELYNAIVYKRTMFANFLLWGNAYAQIHRNIQGVPVSYEIIEPYKVEPFILNYDGRTILAYKKYGDGDIIASSDMIHIADLSFNAIKGLSKITIARQSINLGLSAIDLCENYNENGAFPSVALTVKKRIDDNGVNALKSSFMQQHSGRSNAGNVVVLQEDTEMKNINWAMPFSDAEWLGSRKFQIEEIARFFNVPPHKIGHLEKSSFNNIEQQNTEYVVNTLTPIAKLFEIEHDTKIFSDNEADHFIKIELKGLLRGDVKARTAYYKDMIDRGVLSPNEVRGLEDMTPYVGGDIKILPLNYTTIEKFTQEKMTE